MARRLPNLNQIRVFEAAARHLSFKNAAEELHVTHAAVSHQIKALEADLGMQLFHRRPRQVELTGAGRVYAKTMFRVISEVAEATEALVAEQLMGEITISVAPFFGLRTIVPHLQAFHKAHPGLVVKVEMSGDVIDLQQSEAVAAVRYGSGDWSGMVSMKLFECEVCPVTSPSYMQGRPPIVSPAEISEKTLGKNAGLPDEWMQWFSSAGYRPTKPLKFLTYSNQGDVFDIALSGNGVALADPRWVASDMKNGQLQILHPKRIRSVKTVYLVYPKAEYPDARILAFADWYRNLFASMSSPTNPED